MTTIGQRIIESLSRENDRGDYDAVLKLSRALVTLDSGDGPTWAQSIVPDAPKGPEPRPEFGTVTKPAADLCAADLGRIIETNGYRGRLRRIEVTEEGGYVRLLLSEQHDDGARFPVLVKLDMPVRIMPEVTA
jgi:hypothetical protein